MREVAVDVERDPVQADPAPHTDADGGDLVLAAFALVVPPHPDPDAVPAPLARNAERRQRADDPVLERSNEPAHVRSAALEIKHHIGNALAGPMIGELTAAAGRMDRETGLDQFLGTGAGAGGIQ